MARHIDLTQYSAEVQLAAHAIGLDHKRPYIRHGHRFYRPYRNYFTTTERSPESKEWAILVAVGRAKLRRSDQSSEKVTFWLTRKGLDWLGRQLGITIHDEAD